MRHVTELDDVKLLVALHCVWPGLLYMTGALLAELKPFLTLGENISISNAWTTLINLMFYAFLNHYEEPSLHLIIPSGLGGTITDTLCHVSLKILGFCFNVFLLFARTAKL